MCQCKVERGRAATKWCLESHSLPSLWTKASWECTSFPLLCMGEGETPPSENPTTLLVDSFKSF